MSTVAPSLEPPNVPPKRSLRERLGEPNPIWMREMRQALRLGRTPWILLALTLTISLFLCAVGGIASSDRTNPAKVGNGLFQAFFSIAYMVVVVVGPAVAANGIAAEREGRTWEAVLLAGLDARALTRGKFLAAYTTLSLYIVTLAPVGALSFLFGGVTATEVVTAFVFLFLVAALAVAFGLAVSSLMQSLRGALVTTLALAVMIGPFLYLVFGLGGSSVVHSIWQDVDRESPIWLPSALTRAQFGIRYLMVLVFVPLVLIAVPARFLYAVTVANLTHETDDQSTGLKRWFVFSAPAVFALAGVPVVLTERLSSDVPVAVVCCVFLYGLFCAFLFASDPIGPSRRVRVHWLRRKASFLTRFMGPGLPKTSVLVMLVTVSTVAAIGIVCATLLATGRPGTYAFHVFLVTSYACAFLLFVIGMLAMLRATGTSPWVTRVVAFGIIFLVSAAPWVVAAIGGALSSTGEKGWLMVASPSPFYVFYMIDRSHVYTSTTDWSSISVGFVCEAGWSLLGLLLLWRASARCERTIATYDLAVAKSEAALDEEDARAAGLPPAMSPAISSSSGPSV